MNVKVAITEEYSWISCELVTDFKGLTKHTLGTTGLGEL
jgi:hypothetical protein